MDHPAIRRFREEGQRAHEWLAGELRQLRAGTASPAMLDRIKVEAYGMLTPLSHLASITTEGTRTLRVSVWDTQLVKTVARAIQEADLGFSVVEDERGVRATIPELTSEMREKLVRQVRALLDEARIRVRRARDDAKEAIIAAERAKELSEEEKFRLLEKLQSLVQEINTSLEELAEAKEAAIRS